MKIEVFTAIIESIEKQRDISIEAAKLGIDLLDYEENWIIAITLLLGAYYGEGGSSWIAWYIFEKDDESDDETADNITVCYDIASLWKHVEEIRVSTSFKELELPTEDKLLNLFI